jgi:2-oxo-4-hydroxy-4-carboxy--5-ureidoimidazoline (OHCU) decarboxylase
MCELPRKLSVEELAELFEGRTRFVERLAELEDPLGRARSLARTLPEADPVEALDAHPAIGASRLSARSAAEQGGDEAPELGALNRAYEERFGFRFVVFVAGRSRRELVPVLRRRLERSRAEELVTGIDELVSIAEARWRRS